MEAGQINTNSCSDFSELEKTRNCSEFKKLLETKKVARNTRSCQKVAEQLVESPNCKTSRKHAFVVPTAVAIMRLCCKSGCKAQFRRRTFHEPNLIA